MRKKKSKNIKTKIMFLHLEVVIKKDNMIAKLKIAVFQS
jgi:hypothetical protein